MLGYKVNNVRCVNTNDSKYYYFIKNNIYEVYEYASTLFIKDENNVIWIYNENMSNTCFVEIKQDRRKKLEKILNEQR